MLLTKLPNEVDAQAAAQRTSQPTCMYNEPGVSVTTAPMRPQKQLNCRHTHASRSRMRSPQSYGVACEPLQASLSFEEDLPKKFLLPRSAGLFEPMDNARLELPGTRLRDSEDAKRYPPSGSNVELGAADAMRASRVRGGVGADLRHEFGCVLLRNACCHEVKPVSKKRTI